MNYLENLHVLRDAVAAEPEHLFGLATYEDHTHCGTLHCTAGLAATMPYFQAMGLHLVDGTPRIPGDPGDQFLAQFALNTLFKAHPEHDPKEDVDVFDYLFAEAGAGLWDRTLREDLGDVSDKELALARLDKAIGYWNP